MKFSKFILNLCFTQYRRD